MISLCFDITTDGDKNTDTWSATKKTSGNYMYRTNISAILLRHRIIVRLQWTNGPVDTRRHESTLLFHLALSQRSLLNITMTWRSGSSLAGNFSSEIQRIPCDQPAVLLWCCLRRAQAFPQRQDTETRKYCSYRYLQARQCTDLQFPHLLPSLTKVGDSLILHSGLRHMKMY
jgi:hypothetical protein